MVAQEDVAVRVAQDLLRRPDVAFRAMADPTTRHLVNRAQVDQAQQAARQVRDAVPALPRIAHTMEFVDLVGACALFVASVGRIIPSLRGKDFSDDERETVHRNVAKVRGMADWVETAVDTGNADLDEGLAKLLRGE
jgi:Family of unknown function (DUF6192)